jgi:hypothetical protein
MDAVPRYRERLWPAPWLFVATALVIPASLLVFTPIELRVGVVVGIVLYAGIVGLLLAGSPRIEVTEDELLAGRARIPRRLLGTAEAARGEDAFAERGVRADARAWMLVRGWVDPVVRVPVDDPEDPAPYWLLSTRRPEELAAALNERV